DARHEIIAIRLVVGVLELAATAFGKVTAWRHLMVFAERQRTIIEQCVAWDAKGHVATVCCDPVPARGNADDQLVHSMLASACGMAAARSSAIICGPAISAARPWSQTAAQAASNGANPRARIAAVIPASTSPVPAVASHAGAGGAKPRRPSGEE